MQNIIFFVVTVTTFNNGNYHFDNKDLSEKDFFMERNIMFNLIYCKILIVNFSCVQYAWKSGHEINQNFEKNFIIKFFII